MSACVMCIITELSGNFSVAKCFDVFSPGHKETGAMRCNMSNFISSLQSERIHDVAVPQP